MDENVVFGLAGRLRISTLISTFTLIGVGKAELVVPRG